MKRLSLTALSLLLSISLCRADNPRDPVQLELGALAKKITESLKDHKVLRVGAFVGRGDVHSYFGPEISRVLVKELTALGVQISAKAPIEINGEYRPATVAPEVNQPDYKLTCIRINVSVVDANTGDKINGIVFEPRSIFGETALARALAVPVSLPPTADAKQADELIRKSYQNPTYSQSGNKICNKASSPYSVEMLVVNQKDAPDPASGAEVLKTSQGLPFIKVQRGQYYRLLIHNTSDHEIAVRVSIDGIDQYAFSNPDFRKPDGSTRFNYSIIYPRTSRTIPGWFRDTENYDYFVVTDYAQSAAAELKHDEGKVGQIAVEFRASWETDAQCPADEPKNSRSPLATGREHGGKEKIVAVERTIGVLREVIGLRYGNQLP